MLFSTATGPWLGFYESCSRKNIYECSTHGSIVHNACIVNKIYTLSQANEIILLGFYRGIRWDVSPNVTPRTGFSGRKLPKIFLNSGFNLNSGFQVSHVFRGYILKIEVVPRTLLLSPWFLGTHSTTKKGHATYWNEEGQLLQKLKEWNT